MIKGPDVWSAVHDELIAEHDRDMARRWLANWSRDYRARWDELAPEHKERVRRAWERLSKASALRFLRPVYNKGPAVVVEVWLSPHNPYCAEQLRPLWEV